MTANFTFLLVSSPFMFTLNISTDYIKNHIKQCYNFLGCFPPIPSLGYMKVKGNLWNLPPNSPLGPQASNHFPSSFSTPFRVCTYIYVYMIHIHIRMYICACVLWFLFVIYIFFICTYMHKYIYFYMYVCIYVSCFLSVISTRNRKKCLFTLSLPPVSPHYCLIVSIVS